MTDNLQALLKSYGKLFKALRAKKKLKQDEMASQLGINYRYYQDLEGGKRNFKVETLIKILSHHKVPVGHVANHTGQKKFLNSLLTPLTEKIAKQDELSNDILDGLDFLDSSHYGIQVTNSDGLIVYSNDKSKFFQGADQNDVVGKKYCWDFAADEEEKKYIKNYWIPFVKEKEPPPKEYLIVNKKKDDSLIKLLVWWDYIRNGDGKILGYLALMELAP